MAGPSSIALDGLAEAQKALRKVGGTPDDQRKLNRDVVDELIIPRAKIEVPERSGKLKSTIRSDSTPALGIVLAGQVGTVRYAGVVHFGWATRGMGRAGTRKQLLAALDRDSALNVGGGEFTRRAVLKATRRTRQDRGPIVEREAGTGRYSAGSHRSTTVLRNRHRGGPIKPNPWFYRAIEAKAQGVQESFERQILQRARIEALV
jgi:hypothetical protein